MLTCFECFCESGKEGRALQELVDTLHPCFQCEEKVCSPYSPSPVKNEEQVAFILIDPLHYDQERNVIVPEAFRELTQRDLSVLRAGIATRKEAEKTRDQLILRGGERIPPQLRKVEEVCIASVASIRSVKIENSRALGVYDTALEDKPSHASLFVNAGVFNDRRLRKVVRNRVHEIFTKKCLPFEKFVSTLAE